MNTLELTELARGLAEKIDDLPELYYATPANERVEAVSKVILTALQSLNDAHEKEVKELQSAIDGQFDSMETQALENHKLRAENARLREAHGVAYENVAYIDRWTQAYPPEVRMFAPVSGEDVVNARHLIGDDLFQRLHAEWGRHILKGIAEYAQKARAALATPEGKADEPLGSPTV